MAASNLSNSTRLELLSKENYDTWSMQVEALLTKNELWEYVSGANKMPSDADATTRTAWSKADNIARADLILSIHPSELKHVRGCATSRAVWLKLESIYASKGPARKASLLKKLMLHKLDEHGDVKEHIAKFFDAVDKLEGMSVSINGDLLTIMLLYSLPSSFDNFRCAIESRDELPNSDILKSKIIEESEARKQSTGSGVIAMTAAPLPISKVVQNVQGRNRREFRCFKCGVVGHKASVCPKANNAKQKRVEKVGTFYTTEESLSCQSWILDSGCTTHLCGNRSNFTQINQSARVKVSMANQASAKVQGQGDVQLTVNNDHDHGIVNLKETLYVPDLRANLISVAKITDKNYKVVFAKNDARVYDTNGELIMIADKKGDLFHVRQSPVCAMALPVYSEIQKWHCRLGHLNSADLWRLLRDGVIPDIKSNDLFVLRSCKTCMKGKMSALPFSKGREPCEEALKIIYSDVVGPFRVQSHEGGRYFITFVDDCTRWAEVYFLREKSGAFDAFKAYKEMIEKRTGKQIKSLHSDNGREYVNNAFDKYLAECGIERRLTIPHTPQQNGVAERLNRTLLDMARCLLFQSGLPSSLWARAVAAACHIRNKCPSRTLKWSTPHERIYGLKPKIGYFRVFGSNVMVLDKTPAKGKLAPRAVEGVFIGYPKNQRGYLVWIPSSRQTICARDVKFIGECEYQQAESSDFDELLVSVTDSDKQASVSVEITEGPTNRGVTDDVINTTSGCEIRRAVGRPRIIRTGKKGRPRKEFRTQVSVTSNAEMEFNDFESEADVSANDVPEYGDPSEEDVVFANMVEVGMNEALQSSEVDEWLEAIECEVMSILKYDTWDVIKTSDLKNVVGCRFVLTNKCGHDGKIERRKARLVAKGYRQEFGVNYYHTFAPVARLETLRLMLALSIRYNFSIWQFDVVTAYLHGVLEEKVLMKVPDMLKSTLDRIIRHQGEDSDIGCKAAKMQLDLAEGGNVCLLKKALYGLKQAGRQWYTKICTKLNDIGLKCTKNEPCLFFGKFNDNFVLLLLYVDDILVACKSRALADEIKAELTLDFEMKDLGLAKYCLGLELVQSAKCIQLSQSGYINMLLKQFGLYECNSVSTPAEMKLSMDSNSKLYEGKYYRELIGCLMYISVATRPDIANIVSRLAQFVNNPLEVHWLAAKRILRYLAGTREKALTYKKTEESVIAYTDSDWGGCTIDRRSYSGYVFILSGAAISWKSQKQRTVALSSTEAEYISLAEAAK